MSWRPSAAAVTSVALALACLLLGASAGDAAAKTCRNTVAIAPYGDRWRTDRLSALNTSCEAARDVLSAMIRRGKIVGGGYGDYQVVGRAQNFTCSSRKAAVHYFEFLCRRRAARIHGFVADLTR